MKKLILIANDLPGSGKSTLSEVLVANFTSQELSVGHLATNCSDDADERLSPSPSITAWDFEEDSEMNTLLAHLDESDAVVIDIGTGDLSDFYEKAEDTQLFDILGELGVELTVAIPLHGGSDPTETIVEIAESFSDNADYVVVREGKLPREIWEGSYAQKVMKYLGAVEITAPGANGALGKALGELGYDLHEAQTHRNNLPRALKAPLSKWESQLGNKLGSGAHVCFFPEKEDSRPSLYEDRVTRDSLHPR